MEGRKFYAATINVASARNEQEKRMIKIYNAAMIGAIKQFNKNCPDHINDEDIKDAMSEAALSAFNHIKEGTNGLSYADLCGKTSAIKSSQNKMKHNNMHSALEFCNKDGEWSYNKSAEAYADDTSADSRITYEEEQSIEERKASIIRSCFEQLSAIDQKVIRLKEKRTPYQEIADTIGCSVGAVQKRVSDIAKRFDKLLSKSGYYCLG